MSVALELADPLEIEGFDLEVLAGTGGAGRVWRARAHGSAPVALKIAHGTEGLAALVRETRARVLAGSTAVAPPLWAGWVEVGKERAKVMKPGSSSAAPAIAVPWIDGHPLRDDRSDGSTLALAVAADIAGGLAALHHAGLAHGDVSSSNVIVTPRVSKRRGARLIDLGLSTSRFARDPLGATPRYLPSGGAELGAADERDLFALGLVVAEAAKRTLRTVDALEQGARGASLEPPVAEICAALLAPRASARPGARWVEARAMAALGARSPEPGGAGAAVRATYARIRADVLDGVSEAGQDTAPWLSTLCSWSHAIALLDASGDGRRRVAGPLARGDLSRWIVRLVGPAAARWPLGDVVEVGERRLARALVALAEAKAPISWTLRDLTRAVRSDTPVEASAPPWTHAASGDERAAIIALALGASPADPLAARAVEDDDEAPRALVLAAARALMVAGEPGRALALLHRLGADPAAAALAAEVLRRAGDRDRAEAIARAARTAADDVGARSARTTLARLILDRGDPEGAIEAAGPLDGAGPCEVVALALSATGKRRAALDCVVAGEALANDAEPRARLAGARGYVLAADDPEAAFAAYRAAADYATRAGAVLEEASYLTSAAALAVDEGFLDEAAQTAERAALLWDALGRPGHAARAWLARAAAFATARLPDETLLAAERAEAAADLAGDDLAAAYAALAIADVAEPASELGRAAAARARARVEGASAGDRLRVAARRLRHGDVAETELERLDRAASDPEVAAGPRLEWWGARAVTTDRFRSRGEAVVRALVALASARAPIASRGPALAAGAELAARAGLGDPVSRLSSELRRVADALVSRAGRPFDDAVRHLDWVARAQDPAIDRAEGPLEREQAARLEQLVRSLGSTEDVGDLLRQVLDALVAWTGVERGLLLLRDEGGSLVPRAARNLAQRDLVGEQLALSQSLATSALESLEPVVAVDAAGELPTVHRSVHTLRLRSVLAVPLLVRGDALGVVYLDDRVRRGAFGQRELAWVKTLASLAAAMIATALRAERSAEDARTALGDKGHLERALAERDAHVLVLEQELGRTQGKPRGVRPAFDAIVAESEPMLKTLAIVDRTAAAGIPVLLMGESGSGKELFARAIHEASPRSKKPFVSENCSAIPETLLESALFGHVKGAFTGADRPRVGLFEAADGGTLFLDEVGEMSLAMQAKLLRVLEDGVVRPLGTERSRKVDVRLVAATLRNLEAMVAAKTFREDLYYRISTLTVRIPPLRERASDIPLLVRHFLDKHAGTAAPRGRSEITKAALRRLVDHAWPGNVRQLENEIRRAIVMSEGIIDVGHLSPELADPTKPAAADLGLDVKKRVDLLESDLVREALRRTHGNQTKAAKLLGLSRFGLQKMIKRLAIKA